ncbi:MAG: helix-turn-helix domain-containing protein [Armatimonadetes bacterium]|nr:helix-turn-helix domain-containing protein [Armatimonadota bacterium]
MRDEPPPAMPLQSSSEGVDPKASEPGGEYYTLREAAREAGCSEATLRRLVKSGDVPYVQQETKTGFRYLFEPSTIAVIAHKASMRRPAGRPSGGRVGGRSLQASRYEALQEASEGIQEVAALRTERDLLRAENARLWLQVERLTESVTRLALPPSRTLEAEPLEGASGAKPTAKRSFWNWFFGRDTKGPEGGG